MTMKSVAIFFLAAVLSVAAPAMVNVAGNNHQAGIAYAQGVNEGDGDNNQSGIDEADGDNNQSGIDEADGDNNQSGVDEPQVIPLTPTLAVITSPGNAVLCGPVKCCDLMAGGVCTPSGRTVTGKRHK